MIIKRYKDFITESKDEDLWTYEGDFKVDKSMIMNGKFIKDKIPDVVNGYFYCDNLNLISLEGGPKEVGGDYYCNNNELITLEGAPKKVNGYFNCDENLLTSLEGGPRYIGSNFYCSYNKLTSLKGGPEEIGGDFNCRYNQLTSLEGAPKKVGGKVKSDFEIENGFIESGSYKNNYWEDLLKYMLNQKIDLSEIRRWPKGFLTDETIKSAKGISKFNL